MDRKPDGPNRAFETPFDKNESLPVHCCFASAVAMTRAIRARSVSCEQLMEAHLARIEAVNPTLNAGVTLNVERALAQIGRAPCRESV